MNLTTITGILKQELRGSFRKVSYERTIFFNDFVYAGVLWL